MPFLLPAATNRKSTSTRYPGACSLLTVTGLRACRQGRMGGSKLLVAYLTSAAGTLRADSAAYHQAPAAAMAVHGTCSKNTDA